MIVGILGGGQLAKMLASEGKKLNLKFAVYEENPDACAQTSCDYFFNYKYSDTEKLKEFSDICHVITYEFENIDTGVIETLLSFKENIPQGVRPLYISQNRLREKNAITKLGIETTKYYSINSFSDLERNVKSSKRYILKSCSGGYDGKNQYLVDKSNIASIDAGIFKEEWILEEMVELKREFSVLVFRNKENVIVNLPPIENIHRNGILHSSRLPSTLSIEEEKKAVEIARKIIEELDFIGPLCVEFLESKDGKILVNELAPRPHNSGHLSIESCDYSQFILHLQSILNIKLEEPKVKYKATMLNILGEDKDFLLSQKSSENKFIHIYGKKEWIKNRKMGHITFLGGENE